MKRKEEKQCPIETAIAAGGTKGRSTQLFYFIYSILECIKSVTKLNLFQKRKKKKKREPTTVIIKETGP